ncbi:GIY-YIG nuclease family protein [Chryseobacterium suipulveris]
MFYVYILYSADLDIYYKGFSENVDQRLIYHLKQREKNTLQKLLTGS